MCKSCSTWLLPCLFLSFVLFTPRAQGSESESVETLQVATEYTLSLPKDITLSTLSLTLSTTGLVIALRSDSLSEEQLHQLDAHSVNRFDRSATERWSPAANTASNVTLILAVTASLAFIVQKFAVHQKQTGLTLLLMYAEAMGINFGITQIVKGAVHRNRPFLYNTELTPEERLSERDPSLSFFSGHTSIAFCSATFLATTFSRIHPTSPWRFAVWSGALTLAAGTGVFRYAAGKHFPTDIMMGALVGSVTGILIPILHQKNNRQLTVYPLNGDIRGIGAAISF